MKINSETRLSGELDSIAKLPILFSGLREKMTKLKLGYISINGVKNFEVFELESDSIEDSLNLISKRFVYSEFPLTYSFSITSPNIDDYDY